MKTFIADIFPKIEQYSQKLDNLTLLTNQNWVLIDEIKNSKTVYIFRDNNELLVSTNGQVEKARWEYLGNKYLLIDKSDKSYLFKHSFFDENIVALKSDGCDEYAVFVNENNYDGELNSIYKIENILNNKYILSRIEPILVGQAEQIEIKKNQVAKEVGINITNMHLIVIFLIITIGWLISKNLEIDIFSSSPKFEKSNSSSQNCIGNQSCISNVRENFNNTGKTILGEEYLGNGKFGISFMDSQHSGAFNATVKTDCNCNVTNVYISTIR
jgi:hypothetical protein